MMMNIRVGKEQHKDAKKEENASKASVTGGMEWGMKMEMKERKKPHGVRHMGTVGISSCKLYIHFLFFFCCCC